MFNDPPNFLKEYETQVKYRERERERERERGSNISQNVWAIQWSLYFKTTHATMEIWWYTAGGHKIKGSVAHTNALLHQIIWSYNQGGLKIKGCNIECMYIFCFVLACFFV